MTLISSQGSKVYRLIRTRNGVGSNRNEVGKKNDSNLLLKDMKGLGEISASCGRKWGDYWHFLGKNLEDITVVLFVERDGWIPKNLSF